MRAASILLLENKMGGVFLKERIFSLRWNRFVIFSAATSDRRKIFPCQSYFPLNYVLSSVGLM